MKRSVTTDSNTRTVSEFRCCASNLDVAQAETARFHGRLLGGISVDDDVTPLDRAKSVQNCSLGKKATTALGLIGVREARASHMLPNSDQLASDTSDINDLDV